MHALCLKEGIEAVCRDIAAMRDRLHAEAELHSCTQELGELERVRARSEATLSQLPGLYYVIDGSGRLIDWNRNLEQTTGLSPAELASCRAVDLVIDQDRERAAGKIALALSAGHASAELRIRAKDGRSRPFFFAGSRAVLDGRACIIGVGLDITVRRSIEQRLRELSMRDELTGLLNRRGFGYAARQRLHAAQRRGERVLLLYADVDGLKRINDELGHAAGDAALKEAAGVFEETFRASDVVGRLGGDEFAALMSDEDDGEQRAEDAVSRRFREALVRLNEEPDRAYELSISAGVVSSDAARPLDEILSAADARMYARKRGSSFSS
ncbi:MAG: GGDEF domain-containing protein [Deltaproteobacteria bacterium]|nr:GGDEF domain-containing protein [Deltaproteobacteria bacterium]